MRYAIAALALAGAAMAGEGYNTAYPKDGKDSYDPTYPKDGSKGEYDPATKDAYPKYSYESQYTDYPTDYPHDYPATKSYDPKDPSYPTDYPYDPAYPTYPGGYPTSTKKDDAHYPDTTPCSTSTDKYGNKYPITSTKYDHDEYEHGGKKYTTETIYTTKTYTAKHGEKDVETATYYPITTTVYPVGEKEKYPSKGEKEDSKPSKPSQYPGKEYETKKAEAEKAACPTYSVKTIHTSVTTVVPTVIYETVAVPCPTGKPVPTGGYPSKNGTSPKYPPVTAGSASLAASSLAAFAGLVAFAFL